MIAWVRVDCVWRRVVISAARWAKLPHVVGGCGVAVGTALVPINHAPPPTRLPVVVTPRFEAPPAVAFLPDDPVPTQFVGGGPVEVFAPGPTIPEPSSLVVFVLGLVIVARLKMTARVEIHCLQTSNDGVGYLHNEGDAKCRR